MVDNLIVVKQLPIIEEMLLTISSEAQEKVARALSLVCDENSYKEIKNVRAELNADFKELERRRIEVKKEVLSPYESFEELYKKLITSIYKPADEQLKARIAEVEGFLKAERISEAKSFFDEYLLSKNIDFLTFERLDLNITLNASKKSIHTKIINFIDTVAEDLEMIATQEHAAEILVEYKKTLNASQSIIIVNNRKKAIEKEISHAEKAKLIAEQNEAAENEVDCVLEEIQKETLLSAPQVLQKPEIQGEECDEEDISQIYQVSFVVKTTNIEHLRELKRCLEKLEKEGLEYEQH